MAIFTNQATLTYNGTVTASNIVTGELLEELAITKTALQSSYTVGEPVTYIVTLVNSGTTPLTNVTVQDDLGTYTGAAGTRTPLDAVTDSVRLFADGVLQPAPAVTAGPPLSFTGITVPAGGEVVLVYEARINGFASPAVGAAINNTATATADGVGPLTATAALPVANAAVLRINKAISSATVSPGDRLTYTFTVFNDGNTPVANADGAVIRDTLSPILRDLAVTFNGTPLAAGTDYTYDETTGAFATQPERVSVPAAAYAADSANGTFVTTPGTGTLVITGTV